MTRPTWYRRLVAYLLAPVLLAATWLVAGAAPASAHIPPLRLCTPLNVGEVQVQGFVDGTEDIIVWTCSKGKEITGYPALYYWKHKIISADFETELKKSAKAAVKRIVKEGVWQAVLQSGLAAFGASSVDRAHIRYVGSFELRSWGGSAIERDMGVHMVAKHSTNGGATWSTCGDTGWKAPGSPQAQFSYEFYKLTSSCGGTVQVFTRARFLQASTNTWYTTGFLATAPLTIIEV